MPWLTSFTTLDHYSARFTVTYYPSNLDSNHKFETSIPCSIYSIISDHSQGFSLNHPFHAIYVIALTRTG